MNRSINFNKNICEFNELDEFVYIPKFIKIIKKQKFDDEYDLNYKKINKPYRIRRQKNENIKNI